MIITVFETYYALPQCVYRNKNLSWPKVTINVFKNAKGYKAKNAILKKWYKNAKKCYKEML